MWREMKAWIANASIPNDPDLMAELTALRYGFKGGELLIESKDEAKRRGVKSPDRADSLALTFADLRAPEAELAHPILQGRIAGRAPASRVGY